METNHPLTINTNNIERMRIDSAGNVGVGTTSPAAKLEVKGATAENTQIRIQTDGGASEVPTLLLRRSSIAYGEIKYIPDGGGNQGVHITDYRTDVSNIIFNTAGANERMRIDSNGNVGIGTSSPLADLTVATSMSSSRTSRLYLDVDGNNINGGGGEIIFSTSATSGTLTNLNAKITGTRVAGDGGDSELGFWTTLVSDNVASQQRMVITKEGNVGIGTNNPSDLLTVDGNLSIFGNKIYNGSAANSAGVSFPSSTTRIDGYNGITFHSSTTTVGSQSERMRIDNAGNVLFGTTDIPNGTSVYGSAFLSTSNERMALVQASDTTSLATMQTYYNPNGAVGTIKTTGSATQFNTSSDYRLKKDLKDFNGLDKVSKIPVYDFKWKVDDSRSYGVMAHELQEVLPDAVSGEKDGEEMQGVDYSKIVPLLIKSIQELEAKVKELESK
jgi:hypothetical protein